MWHQCKKFFTHPVVSRRFLPFSLPVDFFKIPVYYISMIDENDLKEIPYAVSDFVEFRESNYYFVDKTRYIRNIEKKGRYLFFIRPRRFGKSLFLSIMGSLLNYCLGKERKLYVIIDEYDNFANTILSSSGRQSYHDITHGEGFLRSFFNVVKGGTTGSGAPISRLFMTGVSPITLDDVTSGFNIGTNISLDDDINEILGFNITEVEAMIEYYRQTGKIHHSTSDLMNIMGQWYNHYRFSLDSECEVFNTILVLYFLREYMKKSRIPDELIDNNARIDYNKLRHLIVIDEEGVTRANGNFSKLQYIIETGAIHAAIEKSFPVADIADTNNFVSLLYYFGLLTIRGTGDENTPVLAIPNEAIKRLYYDYIHDTYKETGILNLRTDTYKTLIRGIPT